MTSRPIRRGLGVPALAARASGAGGLLACGLLACGLLSLAGLARAQEIEFHAPPAAHDAAAAARMRDLAERILPVYQEPRPERYLANLSALQFVAGDFASADATRQSLYKRLAAGSGGPVPGSAVLLDLYVHARNVEAREHLTLEQAFTRSYRETVGTLDGPGAWAVTGLAPEEFAPAPGAVEEAFETWRGRAKIPQAAAVDLVRTYFEFEARRHTFHLLAALAQEDERRRYVIQGPVAVKTADGARVSVSWVRARAAVPPPPAVLEFALRPGARSHAVESAAHGYIGAVVQARGSARAGSFVPFVHDTEDLRAAIDWIAQQPWSDGRVALVGEGPAAAAAYAAVRHPPAALQAIATADAWAPGVDFPGQGGIVHDGAFRWLAEITAAAPAPPGEDARWLELYRKAYRNGDPSGDLDQLFAHPNAIWQGWLRHPDFDAFWQSLLPSTFQLREFDVPVLAVSGYFAESLPGTLYLHEAFRRARAQAQQFLVLGPYGEGAAQREPAARVQGLEPDPSALVDLRELRYRWLDYILRGGPRPALLEDAVNYQVMGADEWRHAANLPAVEDGALRLRLVPGTGGLGHRLAEQAGTQAGQQAGQNAAFVHLTVDLSDRSDADAALQAPLAGASLLTAHRVLYASEALPQALDIVGPIAAHLEFLPNKKDFDLALSLYELTPDGRYLALIAPPEELRASYAADRGHRRLLRVGVRQALDLRGARVTARRVGAGSRLVFVLGINKRPDEEVNLGTGGDVRSEYVEQAGAPLQVRWYADSYIDLPVRPAPPAGGGH